MPCNWKVRALFQKRIRRECSFIAESNTEPRKKFHLLNRLRKAVKHAGQLETLCNQQKACDARTKLEVQVRVFLANVFFIRIFSGLYSSYEWSFEIRITSLEWSITVLHSCSVSVQFDWTSVWSFVLRAIYDNLKTGVRSEDDKQMIDQRIDEITTNARFCQYKSGDKNAAKELRNLRAKAALDDPEMTRVLDVRSIFFIFTSSSDKLFCTGFSQWNTWTANINHLWNHLATT